MTFARILGQVELRGFVSGMEGVGLEAILGLGCNGHGA